MLWWLVGLWLGTGAVIPLLWAFSRMACRWRNASDKASLAFISALIGFAAQDASFEVTERPSGGTGASLKQSKQRQRQT